MRVCACRSDNIHTVHDIAYRMSQKKVSVLPCTYMYTYTWFLIQDCNCFYTYIRTCIRYCILAYVLAWLLAYILSCFLA